jgi:hypothetical protein
MVSALLLSLNTRSGGLFQSAGDRTAVIVESQSKFTAEQAQSILRSRTMPNPKQFTVLKVKQFTFFVEPSVIACAEVRRQLDSLNWMVKNATKEPVQFGRLPLEVQESLAIIGGSSLARFDIKRTQVFLGSGVWLQVRMGKPGSLIVAMDSSQTSHWPSWIEPGDTSTNALKYISLSESRSPNIWSSRHAVKVYTLGDMSKEDRAALNAEAENAVAEARKQVCFKVRDEMESIGRGIAANLPDPTEWTQQKSMLFGELPAHLQRSFLRDRAGIPGYGPGTDLSKEWIEITVPPMVLFDDGKSRLGASFMAGID